MSQLNSLLESANPYKALQDDAARLAGKWSKTGLLEGLDDHNKNNISVFQSCDGIDFSSMKLNKDSVEDDDGKVKQEIAQHQKMNPILTV